MIYVQYNEYHDLYEKTSINEIEKTGLLGKRIVHKIVTATVTITPQLVT